MAPAFRIGDLVPAERSAPGALFATAWGQAEWRAWRDRCARDPDDAGFPAVPPPRRSDARETFADRTRAATDAGWSLDDQFIEPGLVAVAVPVRDASGRAVCAVSVVSHTSRHSADSLRGTALDALRATAAAMERRLAAGSAEAPERVRGAAAAPPAAAWLRASKRELGPEFVESFARGLAVVTAFDRNAPLTLSAAAEATGLPRATARRALITLEHLGYARQDDGLFRLTPRVLDLGFAHLSGLTLPAVAQPHLVELVGRVHESASMAVLVDDDVQYIARVPTVRIMSVAITVGTRFPAYATSLGRVLLAGLPREEREARLARIEPAPLTRHTVTSKRRLAELLDAARTRGFAVVDEELEEGLRSISVPVRDASGRTAAAVNVSMHASRRGTEQAEAELLPALREAATAIEADLAAASRYGLGAAH
jgi:IclR family pca regulon transcriptional regulator